MTRVIRGDEKSGVREQSRRRVAGQAGGIRRPMSAEAQTTREGGEIEFRRAGREFLLALL